MAHTDLQTDIQTDGHGDSMTNSAQKGRVGENESPMFERMFKVRSIRKVVRVISRQYERTKLMLALTTFLFGQPNQRFPFVIGTTLDIIRV